MGVRILDDRRDETIPVREMKDGQIGQITEWGGSTGRYGGTVVQRWGAKIVTLGASGGWDLFTGDTYRVRILLDGTRLEVTDNE